MKRLLALFLAAFLLCTPVAANSKSPQVLESVRGLAWTERHWTTGEAVTSNHCTVFAIQAIRNAGREIAGGYWGTAAHCVGSATTGVIPRDYAIDGHPVVVINALFEEDMAILLTPGYAAKPLKLAKRGVTWGDTVSMVGYPYGYGPFSVRGRVSSMEAMLGDRGPYTMFDISGCPGNSGSPILNGKGEVVSVLQIGFGAVGCGRFLGGVQYTTLKHFMKPYFG